MTCFLLDCCVNVQGLDVYEIIKCFFQHCEKVLSQILSVIQSCSMDQVILWNNVFRELLSVLYLNFYQENIFSKEKHDKLNFLSETL
jgi:hypothetical protein